jgi:hypothetical protein
MLMPLETNSEKLAKLIHQEWLKCEELADRYPKYSGYLLALANSDRNRANHHYARSLTQELIAESHEERIAFIYAMLEAMPWMGHRAGSYPVPGLPYELQTKVVIPSLMAELARSPNDYRPNVWLALLPSNRGEPVVQNSYALLEIALQLAPDNTFVIGRVVDSLVQAIWFACHHIPDRLLNSETAIRADIARARTLLAQLPENVAEASQRQLEYEVTRFEEYVANLQTKNP